MKATREFGRGFQSYGRGSTRGGIRAFPALIWLGFILFPLVDAITTHASPVGKALTIAGAAVFVGSYLALVLMWRQRPWHPKAIALFATPARDGDCVDARVRPRVGLPVHLLRGGRGAVLVGPGRLAVGERLRDSGGRLLGHRGSVRGRRDHVRGHGAGDRPADGVDARPARAQRGTERGARRARRCCRGPRARTLRA